MSVKRNRAHVGYSAIPSPSVLSFDRLRPCTSAEFMAFHHTQTKSSSPLATDAQAQQRFIDERGPLHNPTVAGPIRSAYGDEDEDERDEEMSEPTQLTRAEKRKGD